MSVGGRHSRGRLLSKIMNAAINLVQGYPNISPKELHRLLIGRGYNVSYGYAKKLKKRARRFLSLRNFVPATEGEAIRVEVPEKKSKMGLIPAFQEGSNGQGAQSVNGAGTELTNGVRGGDRIDLPEPNPTMFGVVLPSKFYGCVSSVWNVYDGMASGSRNIRIEKFTRMRNQRDAWFCVYYDDFRMVLTCPSKRRDGDCLLFWRIHRVFSVEKYHERLKMVSDFVKRFGSDFSLNDVILLMKSQYAVNGNPMLFQEAFKATAPDGGVMIFDKSLGFSEYEFSKLEDALEYMRLQKGLRNSEEVKAEVLELKGLVRAVVNALKSKAIIPDYGV